jgi:hypothetical protein
LGVLYQAPTVKLGSSGSAYAVIVGALLISATVALHQTDKFAHRRIDGDNSSSSVI